MKIIYKIFLYRKHRGNYMSLWLKKIIVKIRMGYADLRGHHGKKWNYEPGDNYMGMNKRKRK